MRSSTVRQALLVACTASSMFAEAPFLIVVADRPGVGFNDPAPAEPVGGNPGTTVGQQRLIALEYAAGIWAGKLDSPVPIRIRASFEPMLCDAEGAYFAEAGPQTQWYWRNPGPEFLANTWYPAALANGIAGRAMAANIEEIELALNLNLGRPNCLAGGGWYYGLDHQPPDRGVEMLKVMLHELAHGLGFQPLIHGVAGQPDLGDVYSQHVFDTTAGKSWNELTDGEKEASAGNFRRVVWNGVNVRQAAPKVLKRGSPTLLISAPGPIAGDYPIATAAFGAPIGSPGVSGVLVAAVDPADAAGPSRFDACSPLVNAAEVAGRIALVNRGTCPFTVKAWNVQAAGAIALVVANNSDESLGGAAGSDERITIPVCGIERRDGNAIRRVLEEFGRVEARVFLDEALWSGADREGRPMLYSINPILSGSNIFHWDPSVSPSQLMEPFFEDDQRLEVEPPADLTLPLLMDLGWLADFDGVPGGIDECPGSDRGETVRIQGCDTGVRNTTASNGCRLSDSFKKCVPGQEGFAGCVGDVSDGLLRAGKLAPGDAGAIQACALKNPLP